MELMPQRNLGIPVWGTKSFFRDVEDATPEFRARARNAFIRWRLGVFSKGLNWEKLHNRAGAEFRSIRGSRSIRLLYVERDGGALFFGANLHDYETAETVDLASLVPAGPLESWDPAPGDAEAAIAETESEEGDAPAAYPDLLPEDNPFSDPNAVSNDAMLGLGVLWEHIGAVRNLKDGVALLEMFERHRNVLPEKELMALFDSPRRTTPRRPRTATAAVPRISTTGGPPPSGASGPGFRPISRTPSWRARPGRRSSSARPGRARPRSRSTAPPSSRGPYSTPPATASFSPRSRRRSPRTSRTGSTTSATTPTSAPASTCSP